MIDDLPLFAVAPPPVPARKADPLRDRLSGITPDQLTPLEALALVYEFKGLAGKE